MNPSILWAHLTALAKDIGPRPATSEAEARAHEYGFQKLKEAGADVTVEEFRSAPTFTWAWVVVSLLFLATGTLVWTGQSSLTHGLSVLLGLLGGFFYWSLVSNRWRVLRHFPQGRSRNVIGVLRPQGAVHQKVVLIAHVDSTRASLFWHPKLVRGLESSFWLQTALIILLILAAIWGTLPITEGGVARWLVLPGIVVSLWGLFVLLHRETVMRWVQGANDNASGVAVSLSVMETLAKEPLQQTEVWCVLTGCEEVGEPAGANYFIQRHGSELRDARILVIDNVGAGKPCYLLSESVFPTRKAHPGMVHLAEELARRHPQWDFHPGKVPPPAYTDALPALTEGFHAIGIWCEKDGVLPNWHWHTDTCERVEPDALQTAYEVVMAFVKATDDS